MKFENKLTLKNGIVVLVLALAVFTFIFWNSSRIIAEYRTNPLNGIVEEKKQSNTGILVKLYGDDSWIDLMVGPTQMKHIVKGDSISKMANSPYLYIFKENATEWYPPYLTIY